MKWRTGLAGLTLLVLLCSLAAFAQPASLSDITGFESALPSFWTIGSQPTGTTLTWATDQSHSMGHSLKIVKAGTTTDSAAWISENMADVWSPTFGKDVDILLGAYVKTSGVNINPANDDARWFIVYTFYDKDGMMLNETRLPIDQTTATSTGFVADTNQVGETILTSDATKLIVKFVAGKNATGTVWAGDFVFYGRGAWAGQDWNTGVGVPTGWFYWLPPNGGNDGLLNSGFENTVVTTEAAHSGTHSLKFVMPAGRTAHDGFVGTRRMSFADLGVPNLKPGDSVRVRAWVKASGLQPDSAAAHQGTWNVGLTALFFGTTDPSAGYNPAVAGDSIFMFPSVTNFDWTQYSSTFYVPKDSVTTIGSAKGLVNSLEVRCHVYSTFVGTVYFDDITIERIPSTQNLTDFLSFESALPSFWTIGNQPTGTTLTWATDQSHSMGHSLKIVKAGTTTDSAAWISENMADVWSPTFGKDVDILLGAYVKTSGVNINPANDDARWFIVYTFYDKDGMMLNETRLPIDQTTATSTGFVADTNQVGETILTSDATKLIVKFVAGKNATGTVWAGDFVFYGRGAWAGQDWNTGVGVPTGWFYWLPPNGGNDGLLNSGFENTVVTTEAAHSGTHSLKFVMPAGRTAHDGFVGTRRMSFADLGVPNLKPGDSVRVRAWVKASGLQPDSAAAHQGTWNVGLTALFFGTTDPSAGYNPAVAGDSIFMFPSVTNFDWTQYSSTFYVPKDSVTTIGSAKGLVNSLEVRCHVYSTFVGTVYFDDITIERVSGTTAIQPVAGSNLPKVYELSNNYPNPFNPSTVIEYAVPKASNVSLIIYNILGQQVRTLVDQQHTSGRYTITWDGRDNLGHTVGSGVYFYRLNAGETSLVKKMLMLK